MNAQTEDEQLAKLVETVLASTKYKEVAEDFVRSIGMRELARRSSLKEAIKATKGKLHQVGGAYQAEEKAYTTWLTDLEEIVRLDNPERLRMHLKLLMRYHASTRERLPILEQFYPTVLADLPPLHSVLDIACGFHPLALPWMPLTEPVEYYACDIYKDLQSFLAQFLSLMRVQGHAQTCDVIQSCPTTPVDVAFVLKTLPCLEQVDKTAGLRLLQTINAKYIVVSFPVHSLGGRTRGMLAHYEAQFRALVASTGWSSKRFTFPTELAFLITK